MVENISSAGCLVENTSASITPTQLILDLAALTSHFSLLVKNNPANSSRFKLLRNPTCVAIALAPYWAIACLITQLGAADVESPLKSALLCLLSTKVTREASIDVHAELSFGLSTIPGSSHLKNVVNSFLCNPLLFAVQLSLLMRSSLEKKYLACSAAQSSFLQTVIKRSDSNSRDAIKLLTDLAPQWCLMCDQASSQSHCLAHVAAYRSSIQNDLGAQLAVMLCQILAKCGPSAGAIPDRRGRCPIHIAAEQGNAAQLVLLASLFPYTAPLRDQDGFLPLERALERVQEIGEDAIAHLVAAFPDALLLKTADGLLVEKVRAKCSSVAVQEVIARVEASSSTMASKSSQVGSVTADTDNESHGSGSPWSSESESMSSPRCDDPSLVSFADSLLLLRQGSMIASGEGKKRSIDGAGADMRKRSRS